MSKDKLLKAIEEKYKKLGVPASMREFKYRRGEDMPRKEVKSQKQDKHKMNPMLRLFFC